MTTFAPSQELQQLIRELKDAFQDNLNTVSTEVNDLTTFAQSKYPQFPGIPHAVVVHVRSTEDVVKIVQLANKHRVPIVPYAAGTSLEGNVSGTSESICVDLSRMNRIIQINVDDADVICEAGVVWNVLNDTLKEKGIPLFFPLDPAPGATIGGMIAQGCSGTNAVRYGTARGEYILNVTAVLPSGEVIKTRKRARKCSAGFDLTKLFIGAEGTLGIVTEATVRLVPRLPISIAVVGFPDVRSATKAVCEIVNEGAAIQCAELCDHLAVQAMNRFGKFPRKWIEMDTVFFKYQGSDAVRDETSRLVEQVAGKHGGTGYTHIVNEEEGDILWSDRKSTLFGVLSINPGYKGYITDVCVPVSHLPDLIYATKKDLADRGLVSPLGGHIGDGNFHCFILYHNDTEYQYVKEVADAMIRKAIALDGTCTGEHGIGMGKKQYLVDELGEGTVALMKTIKNAFDPHNLFNPGKLYPD
ncbi:FAD-binding domain-containing protein [Phellopilus nigrolimitatus]|nr:FAD-binding domain-containing protein [Phellopilus nigrolimitatus]